MEQNRIKLISLPDLVPHPLLAVVPTTLEVLDGTPAAERKADTWERLNSDHAALVATVGTGGIQEPLKVIPGPEAGQWWVVDGRERLAAAGEAGLECVPCVEMDFAESEDGGEAEIKALVAATVTGRRHWTKAMKAYLAVKLNPHIVETTKGSGMQKRSYSVGTLSRAEVAARYGVSLPLIDQACELYRRCYDKAGKLTKAGALVEPGVWLGKGLGYLLSGLGGVTKNPVGEPRRPSSLGGAEDAWKSFSSRVRLFSEWKPEEQAAFGDVLASTVGDMPAVVKAKLREALAEEV